PMQGLDRNPRSRGGLDGRPPRFWPRRSPYLMTVKLFVLVAVPAGLVTVIEPVFAFVGTVIVSFDPETILNLAGMPWKVTEVVPVRFVPVTLIDAPGRPFVIESFVIVGVGAVIGRKPYLSIVA